MIFLVLNGQKPGHHTYPPTRLTSVYYYIYMIKCCVPIVFTYLCEFSRRNPKPSQRPAKVSTPSMCLCSRNYRHVQIPNSYDTTLSTQLQETYRTRIRWTPPPTQDNIFFFTGPNTHDDTTGHASRTPPAPCIYKYNLPMCQPPTTDAIPLAPPQ